MDLLIFLIVIGVAIALPIALVLIIGWALRNVTRRHEEAPWDRRRWPSFGTAVAHGACVGWLVGVGLVAYGNSACLNCGPASQNPVFILLGCASGALAGVVAWSVRRVCAGLFAAGAERRRAALLRDDSCGSVHDRNGEATWD